MIVMKLLVILFSILLISCQQTSSPELPDSKTIALVGDFNITEDLLNAFMHSNGLNSQSQEQVHLAMEGLIDEVSMANIAKSKNLELTTQQLNTLYYLDLKAHSQLAKIDYMKNKPIAENEIQAEYEKVQKATGGLEYNVQHMLFKDEVDAIKELDNIKTVEDYLKAEAQYLEKNDQMKNVGNLGWLNLKQLPKSFADSIVSVDKNTVIPFVVKSQFGASVVYLKDTRELIPPTYEEVKSGIVQSLKNQRGAKFKQLARAKAKVKLVQ